MWNSIASLVLLISLTLLPGTSSLGKEAEATTIGIRSNSALPTIEIKPQRTYPGDVIFVHAKNVQTVTLFKKTYQLQLSSGSYVRFIPVPVETKPGVYPVQTSNPQVKTTITVAPKTFATDSITVSSQMNAMRQNTARIDADQKEINVARSQSAKTAYFADTFQMPTQGRLTTPYGYQRVVNGKPSNRHMAIDIANKQGTPIVASNHGRVVLAESLYLTGNTVIIDHGLTLFSIYAHMSKLDVKPGQQVAKGQLIGKIGTTGFSTGPHLHYGMLIGNTYINPNPFFQSSPFSWK